MKKKSKAKTKALKKKPGLKKGQKIPTTEERDKMKSIIRSRMIFRDDEEKLLIALEDKGFNISAGTLYTLKKEIREDLGNRLKEIGTYELAEEHQLAISMMKFLEQKMVESIGLAEDPRDFATISQELRNIKRDLIDYYGSSEMVENVFKYFQEQYGDKAEEEYSKVKNELQKKS